MPFIFKIPFEIMTLAVFLFNNKRIDIQLHIEVLKIGVIKSGKNRLPKSTAKHFQKSRKKQLKCLKTNIMETSNDYLFTATYFYFEGENFIC
jgi:hypothetical protein